MKNANALVSTISEAGKVLSSLLVRIADGALDQVTPAIPRGIQRTVAVEAGTDKPIKVSGPVSPRDKGEGVLVKLIGKGSPATIYQSMVSGVARCIGWAQSNDRTKVPTGPIPQDARDLAASYIETSMQTLGVTRTDFDASALILISESKPQPRTGVKGTCRLPNGKIVTVTFRGSDFASGDNTLPTLKASTVSGCEITITAEEVQKYLDSVEVSKAAKAARENGPTVAVNVPPATLPKVASN